MSKKVYGYCRISTKQQSIERQIRNIQGEYPKADIRQESFTGRTLDRPEWNKLLKVINQDDVIVFDSVSRMSRNADDGFKLYQELFNKGITLVFLKEPHINTDTYRNALNKPLDMTGNVIADVYLEATNKVMMILAQEQIRLAFLQSQKEVDDLSQRVKEGIVTARIEGKQIGQAEGKKLNIKKEPFCKAIIQEQSRDFQGTLKDDDVIAIIIQRIKEHNKKEESKPSKQRMILRESMNRGTYYNYKRDLGNK